MTHPCVNGTISYYINFHLFSHGHLPTSGMVSWWTVSLVKMVDTANEFSHPYVCNYSLCLLRVGSSIRGILTSFLGHSSKSPSDVQGEAISGYRLVCNYTSNNHTKQSFDPVIQGDV